VRGLAAHGKSTLGEGCDNPAPLGCKCDDIRL
jgi:hypothetical protein